MTQLQIDLNEGAYATINVSGNLKDIAADLLGCWYNVSFEIGARVSFAQAERGIQDIQYIERISANGKTIRETNSTNYAEPLKAKELPRIIIDM